jgi:hypothetical protein
MPSLRKRVIKLAHDKPEIRKDLLPLLRQAKPKTARRSKTAYLDDFWHQLVEMEAESMGLPRANEAYATSEVEREVSKFEDKAEDALEKWVNKNPDALNEGYTYEDLWDEEGPYLIAMTMMGHGVGIWDGSWDRFFADRGRKIKDLQKFLKRELSRILNDTGSGSLGNALINAAYETAEEDEDDY